MANQDTKILQDILSKVPENLQLKVRKHLQESLNQKFDEENEVSKGERWIEWAKPLKYLKLVESSVPDFILPQKCSGELIDVKVFTKRGPDDQVYDTYAKVREKVARGNCFLNVTHGKKKGIRCILQALKKFTGGLGDDDDRDRGDNHTWKRYFTQPLENAVKIVATRKANGEAAHLSCIELDSQKLICAGSKNVHLLIRNRGDISYYRGDRYRIASEICHSVMDRLEEIGPEESDRLLSFMVKTKYTAVFEILVSTHQHVEDLSHLDKPQMKFITWTSSDVEPTAQQQMCTLPPHIGIEIARALRLDTIDYDVLDAADVDARMKQIRAGYKYEGEVLYFLDEKDNVFGLLKKKTVWYIICRAIREKAKNAAVSLVKNKSTFSHGRLNNNIEKRLNDIQSWLGLSEEAVVKWKVLGIDFCKWILERVDQGEKTSYDIGDFFPVLWKEFLETQGKSDVIEFKIDNQEENISVLTSDS